MKFTTKSIGYGRSGLCLKVPDDMLDNLLGDIDNLMQAALQGKTLTVEIDVKREKRSLNANAFLWQVLDDIAKAVCSTKDEVYELMLKRYGKFRYVTCRPDAVQDFIKSWNGIVEEKGEVEIHGENGTAIVKQLLCYLGSSTYNTKEFSQFLDGVLSEAKDIGLEYDRSVISAAQQKAGRV